MVSISKVKNDAELRQGHLVDVRSEGAVEQGSPTPGLQLLDVLTHLEQGDTEIIRILIQHGARPCLRTEHGWTPAHFAAESGRLEVLRLLHSLHAPIDKEDSCGDKPVRIAEIYGHQDCVRFLKKAEPECQAYRKKAAQQGILLDDTDEEWEQQSKEHEENIVSGSNDQT